MPIDLFVYIDTYSYREWVANRLQVRPLEREERQKEEMLRMYFMQFARCVETHVPYKHGPDVAEKSYDVRRNASARSRPRTHRNKTVHSVNFINAFGLYLAHGRPVAWKSNYKHVAHRRDRHTHARKHTHIKQKSHHRRQLENPLGQSRKVPPY